MIKEANMPIALSRRAAVLTAACAATCLAATSALAQAWPSKPIQLVIPYPPGGSADLLAHPLALQLQQQLGQPVVLEYKAGAGGTVASQYVARSKPDGYTILMVLAAHAINDSLYPKLPYDTRKDFTPVSLVANLPMIIVASKKLDARDVPSLIAAAKKDPGALTFGSAGNGNTGHLAGELFSTSAGVQMTHVPYKGSAGVVNAMLAGDIHLTFDSISTSIPHVKSGKMFPIAVTSAKRSALDPSIPTVQEQGIKDFEVNGWYAIIGPANMPAEVSQRLSSEIAKAVAVPQLKEQMAAGGYEPVGSTPEQLKTHIDNEITRWAKVVKSTGARID